MLTKKINIELTLAEEAIARTDLNPVLRLMNTSNHLGHVQGILEVIEMNNLKAFVATFEEIRDRIDKILEQEDEIYRKLR